MASLVVLGVLSVAVVLVVLSAQGPFQGSLIPLVTYSIVLFTITGVLDECNEPIVALFAFFGIGIHSIVAIYSFFPKEKEEEKEVEKSAVFVKDHDVTAAST